MTLFRKEKVTDKGIRVVRESGRSDLVNGFVPATDLVAVYRSVEATISGTYTGVEFLLAGNRYAQIQEGAGSLSGRASAVDDLVNELAARFNIPVLPLRTRDMPRPTVESIREVV